MKPNLKLLFSNNVAKVIIVTYTILLLFWLWILFNGLKEGTLNNLYGAIYPLISLIGGLYGILWVSKKWGGYKTLIGRGIVFLSLGLLAEVFGQWAWTYYVMVQNIQIPYPSIADIGYFAIIPLYSYAMYNFAKSSGITMGLKSFFGKIQAIIIPLLMVAIAYFLFLRNISIDLSNPLKTFLDFGYPGFEIIAISIAILTYSLSRNVLGGIMRPKILFIVFALVFQYITDYLFLYQSGAGTYYNGGVVDLLYTTSFMIMALVIVQFSFTNGNRKSLSIPTLTITEDMAILDQILIKIIKEQEFIVGPVAWEEIVDLPGIIIDQSNNSVSFSGDKKDLINRLVEKYELLFGKASRKVCKDAVRRLVTNMSPEEIPSSLR